MNSHPAPTTHDRARAALAIGPVTWSSAEGNGRFHMSVDSLPSELIDAQLAALDAAGLAVVDAERDALLARHDVGRAELAMALCEAWRYECEEGVSKYPESWLPVADALLATWRVVRR